MSSRCNPSGIGWVEYQKNGEACHKVSKWIVDNLAKSIELRHRIGSEMLSGSNADSAAQSKSELAAAIAPIQDAYEQGKAGCKKDNDAVSCILAEKYADLLRFFGPLNAISRNVAKPTARDIAHLQNGYVVTPTGRDGPPYEVLIDTAANYTALSRHLAGMFKEHISLLTDGAHGEDSPFVSVSNVVFDMGGVSYTPSMAFISSIVDFIEGSKRDKKLVAILGADFLFGRPWEVNYDSSQFIIDQDVQKRLAEKNGWDQVPLSMHPCYLSYYLGVRVYIDGKPYTLALDTGASGTSLNEQCFSPTDIQKITGGITKSFEGRSRNMRVKDAKLKIGSREVNLKTYDITPRNSRNAESLHDVGLCGLLGTDVLRNFNFIYDPETMSLYLSPRKDTADIPEQRGIGFVPNRMKTGDGRAAFEVVDVVPGSDAEKSGIKTGDAVIEMAGTTPDKLSLLEFLDMYYSNDPNLPVKVLRDGKVVEIIIKRD